jgi:hypothetical protein
VGVADRCVKARETLSCDVSGRRIVELDVQAKGLDGGCMLCRAPLSLSNVCKEYRRELGSTLFISCKCGCSTAVKTGKQHADSSKKKLLPIYDVNTKLTCFKYYSWISTCNLTKISAPMVLFKIIKCQIQDSWPPSPHIALYNNFSDHQPYNYIKNLNQTPLLLNADHLHWINSYEIIATLELPNKICDDNWHLHVATVAETNDNNVMVSNQRFIPLHLTGTVCIRCKLAGIFCIGRSYHGV